MKPKDIIDEGWVLSTAQQYGAFTRTYSMYAETSKDLVSRAQLSGANVVVDLCGGTGATAEEALKQLPAGARLYSVDISSAMQAVGRNLLDDRRVSWIRAQAEDLSSAISEPVDAVLCNSAIWMTDVSMVFAEVKRILRPGGRFIFNIGGPFVGLPQQSGHSQSPSLGFLIDDVATREFGYQRPRDRQDRWQSMSKESVETSLAAAGFRVLASETLSHEGTVEERRAWLSIPVFARPAGFMDHATLMSILERAWSQVDQTGTTVTNWLVITAEA